MKDKHVNTCLGHTFNGFVLTCLYYLKHMLNFFESESLQLICIAAFKPSLSLLTSRSRWHQC